MKVNLVSPKDLEYTYTTLVKERLKKEHNIDAQLVERVEDADKCIPTVIEYQPMSRLNIDNKHRYILEVHSVPTPKRMGLEILAMAKKPSKIVSNLKTAIKNPRYALNVTKRGGNIQLRELQNQHTLLLRTEWIARNLARLQNYKIMPLINYPPLKKKPKKVSEICLGSVSIATRTKNLDKVAEIATKLGVRAVVIASTMNTDLQSKKATSEIAQEIFKKYNSNKVQIITGAVSESEKEELLGECSHFLQLQDETYNVSWSIRDMARFMKPVITMDTIAGKEANAITVNNINKIDLQLLEKTKDTVIRPPDGLPVLADILKNYKVD